ncbi:hypothetical protein Lal_00000981 [Lupinus albus]|nr:hypothetical protein Lal_00000981 [Lupinus albus]
MIIRDIVSDFSDEDDIELIGDDDEDDDVEIGSSELHDNITYATPSSFITYTNYEASCDYRPGSTTLRKDNDLFVGMQFESKESTLDAIKQFHVRNSFDYIVVESMPDRYVGRCKHYGADPGIPIKAILKEIVSRFGYIVTYRKTWNAKQLAMSQIYGLRSN